MNTVEYVLQLLYIDFIHPYGIFNFIILVDIPECNRRNVHKGVLTCHYSVDQPKIKLGDGKPVRTPSYSKNALERSLTVSVRITSIRTMRHRINPDVPMKVLLEVHRYLQIWQVRGKWVGLRECNVQALKKTSEVPGLKEVTAAQLRFIHLRCREG